jgi:hypothetical protein
MTKIIDRRTAIRDGVTLYFTGKPCRRGHFSVRYTCNSVCRDCLLERNKTVEYKAYSMSYRTSESGINARKKHASSQKAKVRTDRYRQAGKTKEWSRRHRETGRKRETVKAWCHRNRDKTAAWWALYNARRIEATPVWLTSAQKKEILAVYRDANRSALTVDHIVPLRGRDVCGLHVPWNLQLLSKPDNSKKGNRFDHYNSAPARIGWLP